MDSNSSKTTTKYFIDYYCYGLLNHLLTSEDFQAKNIDKAKITKIDTKEKGTDNLSKVSEDIITFIIRPDKEIFNVVVEIHLILKAIRKNLIENIIFIPKENYDIIEYMTTNHMMEEFNVESFNIDLIPIDIDLFSLEKENSLKEIYIDKNLSCISDLANAVVKLETCFGKINHKYIKGDLAQAFCNIVKEKEKDNDFRISEDEILGMVVFDRSVDFITLMTTNYTYEGLIDENIGINLGRIKVKESLLLDNINNKIAKANTNPQEKKKEKIVQYGLTTNINPFYCSLRCMHYLDALKYLKGIKDYYKKIFSKNQGKQTISELREVTEQLSYYKSLEKDLLMNENLMNFVIDPLLDKDHLRYIEKEQRMLAGDFPPNLHSFYDELLCEQKDLISIVKLMVIESLTQNGVYEYQKLKREILNIYGFQKIFLFRDLEILGWLKEKTIIKNIKNIIDLTYNQLYDKLQLVSENSEPMKIEDCSYVLSGFSPISLKIIETAVRGQWSSIIDILRKMPGATYCPENETVISNPKKEKNIMFIIFIGGVTYTEIEAIRFLNRKFNEENLQGKRKKTQFIILTTSILNSRRILENLGKDPYSIFNMKMFYEQNRK